MESHNSADRIHRHRVEFDSAARITRAAFAKGIAPVANVIVSEWARQNRRVCGISASATPWIPALAPLSIDVMNAMSRGSPIQNINVMAAVQLMKSQIVLNSIYSYVATRPVMALLVLPQYRGVGESYIDLKLKPEIAAMGLRVIRSAEGGVDRALVRKFETGAFLYCGFALVPSSISSNAFEIVACDEVDDYMDTGQGPPDKLAEGRAAQAGATRKILKVSSPKRASGLSRIEALVAGSDIRLRFIGRCPRCNSEQPLEFDNLQFNRRADSGAELGRVYYKCAARGCEIAPEEKPKFLAAGHYRDQAGLRFDPFRSDALSVGVQASALYSHEDQFGWESFAREFIEARRDPLNYKSFLNMRLAETDDDAVDVIDERAIRQMSDAGKYRLGQVPEDALVLLAGCDPGKNYIVADIWAWSAGAAYFIDRVVHSGSPLENAVWNELHHTLMIRKWSTQSGRQLRVYAAAVDVGGAVDSRAWGLSATLFCAARGREHGGIYAVRGSNTEFGYPIKDNSAFVVRDITGRATGQKYPLAYIDTALVKDSISALLSQKVDGGRDSGSPVLSFHFPVDLSQRIPAFATELASERAELRRTARGQIKRVYTRIATRRAEALDCLVYAFALRYHSRVGVAQWSRKTWSSLRAKITGDAPAETEKIVREAVAKFDRPAAPLPEARAGFPISIT